MIIVMTKDSTENDKEGVIEGLRQAGFAAHRSTGSATTVIGVLGVDLSFDSSPLLALSGVEKVFRVSKPYKLASREFQSADTVIRFENEAEIGGKDIAIMAGPCSVESRQQMLDVAHSVKESGVQFLRGGAFKPRSSPYSFQGLGEKALSLLREAADETNLNVVSEVMEIEQIPLVHDFVDIMQVGARNAQNFNLLKAVGRQSKPVLLKRGMSMTYEELLLSAEYIMSEGQKDVILCERGIRTFETFTRNTLDIAAIPVLQELTHLPVIVDPSHGTGLRDKVQPMAMAAIAAGADGLIVEVHNNPDKARCDGAQSLWPHQFEQLMGSIHEIAGVVNRSLKEHQRCKINQTESLSLAVGS